MKKLLLILLCMFFMTISNLETQAQKVLFLHHSTGSNLYNQGNVADYIDDYNNNHSTFYEIDEFSYPNTPYPWANYPYDYWNLWINQSCDNEIPNIMCLDEMASNYDVIIWKHCYPGAAIIADNGDPNVASPERTLANYKLQYNALLELMDQYPDTKFIVWTLAPLHRNATNPEQAARANEFVTWVKESWLEEDVFSHPNIYIFDFFGNAAEMETDPENGVQYCLKYDYEGDHSGSDSHPNTLANETIGPVFSQFIIDVIEDDMNATYVENRNQQPEFQIRQNTTSGIIKISGKIDAVKFIDIYNLSGQKKLSTKGPVHQINTDNLPKGIYFVQISTQSERFNYKILLQ